jgi:hypothetical protein
MRRRVVDKLNPQKAPFRLAYRKEGEFVNAYYAEPGTMEGAILLGSMRVSILDSTPGLFDDFQACMRKALEQACRNVGFDMGPWQVFHAPEHERTGDA